jgi:hypothetical protein
MTFSHKITKAEWSRALFMLAADADKQTETIDGSLLDKCRLNRGMQNEKQHGQFRVRCKVQKAYFHTYRKTTSMSQAFPATKPPKTSRCPKPVFSTISLYALKK